MYEPMTPDMVRTRGGVVMTIRPTRADDGDTLARLFARLTPEDLRFRFLTSVGHVDAARLAPMLATSNATRATFVAVDPEGEALAVAMIAADDAGRDAEVAISVRSDMKARGIGWSMLDHVWRYAKRQGFASLESIESRDNRAAIDLERDAGFSFAPCDGDASDVVARRPVST